MIYHLFYFKSYIYLSSYPILSYWVKTSWTYSMTLLWQTICPCCSYGNYNRWYLRTYCELIKEKNRIFYDSWSKRMPQIENFFIFLNTCSPMSGLPSNICTARSCSWSYALKLDLWRIRIIITSVLIRIRCHPGPPYPPPRTPRNKSEHSLKPLECNSAIRWIRQCDLFKAFL